MNTLPKLSVIDAVEHWELPSLCHTCNNQIRIYWQPTLDYLDAELAEWADDTLFANHCPDCIRSAASAEAIEIGDKLAFRYARIQKVWDEVGLGPGADWPGLLSYHAVVWARLARCGQLPALVMFNWRPPTKSDPTPDSPYLECYAIFGTLSPSAPASAELAPVFPSSTLMRDPQERATKVQISLAINGRYPPAGAAELCFRWNARAENAYHAPTLQGFMNQVSATNLGTLVSSTSRLFSRIPSLGRPPGPDRDLNYYLSAYSLIRKRVGHPLKQQEFLEELNAIESHRGSTTLIRTWT